MGRAIIQHPETKKYAIWSSVVDDFVTDWLSEDELKLWQINEYDEQIKEQPIEVSRFKTYEDCLFDIEVYHGKKRVEEVKDGGKKETSIIINKLGLLSITGAIMRYLDDLGYSYKQIHEFLNTAEIEIDSGWECSETSFKSVWVNLEKNKICLVNEHEERYSQEYEREDYKGWDKVLEDKEEDL